jgi:HPt (histidine-containing phosphotransfer) domain-containing protein
MFLEDGPGLIDEMRRAIESGDAAALRLAAHTLKGNAAEFGATALSRLARDVEAIGAAGGVAGAAVLVGQAQDGLAQVRVALASLRDAVAAGARDGT